MSVEVVLWLLVSGFFEWCADVVDWAVRVGIICCLLHCMVLNCIVYNDTDCHSMGVVLEDLFF